MKRIFKLIPFILSFCLSISAHGYEVDTHEEMSVHAIQQSALFNETLIDIGLGSPDIEILSDGTQSMTIVDWIRYGANHEDDTFPLFGPGGFRYLNHFYNPLNGQGFTHWLLPNGLPAPLWGLEVDDLGNASPIDGQEYSLNDAREWLYNGLTRADAAEREQYLAKTFLTLGHVMHLVEDAAVPEHVRNDAHPTGSLYENFTNALRYDLSYDVYPTVSFNAALSFWRTRDSQPGQGLAEYSNRGFVSDDTNFRFSGSSIIPDPNFPSPAFDPSSELTIDITTALEEMPWCNVSSDLQGELTFFGNTITDSYNDTTDFNQYATTLSIFDSDLPYERFFTLNRFNFCAAQQRLIPRAVGYSAGLVDYFFRGRLETNYTLAAGQLTVNVKNNSGPENTLKDGTFELYYDAADGTRKPLSIINGAHVDSTGIVDGGDWTITAGWPTDTDSTKQSPFVLTFRGLIGSEVGILGKILKQKLYLYTIGDFGIYKYTTEGALVFGPLSWRGLYSANYTGIAADREFIYVAGREGFFKYSKQGDLIFGPLNWSDLYPSDYFAIATDEEFVYIVGDDGLVKYSKNGALIFGPIGNDQPYYDLALDAHFVYIVGRDGVYKYSKNGALVFGLVGGSYNAIAIDEEYFYVVSSDFQCGLFKFRKDGTLIFGIGTGYCSFLNAVSLDEDFIYIACYDGIYKHAKEDGTLILGPIVSNHPNDDDTPEHHSIAEHGDYLYAAGEQGLYKFTKDGDFLYWNFSEEGSEFLMKGIVIAD